MTDIQLRQANLNDEEFVNNLTNITIKEYVELTWESEHERRIYYEINGFCQENTRIIQYKGIDIGRISVNYEKDKFLIEEIHILPEYQKKGIGRRIIQDILKQASNQNASVELFLLKVNPVKKLYESLGFKVYKESNERFYMRKLP